MRPEVMPPAPGTGSAPVVTIGMPLFNEERFAAESLRSIQSQTFEDFELIISDNASTDRTGEICREVAATDPRVRYVRNQSNIGAAANFDRVIHLASGQYFLWAGGHDLWHEELIARSVSALEARPGAAIAVAECVWIDTQGERIERRSGWTDTSGMSSLERFFTVLWGNMHPILGLMRTDALRATAGVRSCMGADLLLLCELALQGDFIFVPSTRWFRREIRPQESYAEMVQRHRSAQYALASGLSARFPLLTLGKGLLGIAWGTRLPLVQRLIVCAGLLGMMPARYVGARLRRT